MTLAVPLAGDCKLAWQQFPRNCCHKSKCCYWGILGVLLGLYQTLWSIEIATVQNLSNSKIQPQCTTDIGQQSQLTPCCASFHRFLIASTNFQAQMTCCQVSRCCSDPTGLYWFLELLQRQKQRFRWQRMHSSWYFLGKGQIAEVSITTDSEQYKITFLFYFCILNRLKVKSDDRGFVLKEIQEMKWRDTFQSTASKELRISKKMERYERGRTTTMRMGSIMGMKNKYDILDELPSEREEIPTWPNPAWQVLGFRRQKFVGEYLSCEKLWLGMEHNLITHPSLVVELYTGRATSAARRLFMR